jgi:HipA-like protein
MRKAEVFCKDQLAGLLTELNNRQFVFRYDDKYFVDTRKLAISLTLPKTKQEYASDFLFPFFANMLSEGANRKMQGILLKIDENDDFGILLATAQHDTIGAITVKPISE